MSVLQRSTGRFAMIFEDQNVLKAAIFFQVEDSIAERPKDIFNSLWGKRCQAGGVVRRLNNHFMSTDTVHLVEHAFGLTVQIAFNSERGKLVRNYSHRPARGIALHSGATIRVRAIRMDLRRGP